LSGFKDLVDGIIEVDEAKAEGFLAVVDDYHTVNAEELKHLAQNVPQQLYTVKIVPTGLVFDEKFSRWFFAATREWREIDFLTVDDLKAVMPPKTVSRNANRVAVWGPILRAFNRTPAKVTRAGKMLLTSVLGDEEPYLTAVDLENKMFACSCPAYNHEDENWRKRHLLCKHLMLSIYHHHPSILEAYGDNGSWEKSLKKCQKHPHSQIMLANWLYYFVKKVFAKLNFQAGTFEDWDAVDSVLNTMV
jgi:hypothetical protein